MEGTIGDVVHVALVLNISSNELARKTGLHADHVSNLRRRKSLPMVLTLCMIADALGCTPNDLLGEGDWE